ncbi:hypothetical protein [Nocardia sp. NPDC127526]|uniref:DUF7373 family lipoprotein n=1 Tax=Nocardia sp. NPDC127526 TaxID=3345393 RepID=UPI0036395F09
MRTLRIQRVGRKAWVGFIATGIVGACAVTAVGCNDVPGDPTAGEIDVRTLDVGNYPTTPLDLRAIYDHAPSTGQDLAVGRLAGAIANGIEIDPSLKYGLRTKDITTSFTATMVFTEEVKPIVERYGMMFGFTATTSTHPLVESNIVHIPRTINAFDGETPDPASTSVNITILQFPDEQRARSAAEEIEAADFAVAPENAAVTIDKYPSARAHWRPGVPSLGSTIAHGAYLVNVYVEQPTPELDRLKEYTEKVLATQLPLLDTLPPLTNRDMLLLDYDPDSMLQRTLHPGKYPAPAALSEMSYVPRAFLHFVSDQSFWKKLIDDNGVDRISTAAKGGLLMRAPDAEAAAKLWSEWKVPDHSSADTPTGMRDVFCAENPKPKPSDFGTSWNVNDRYYCTVRYDRYVARVHGMQLKDVHQRAAAQYALLANSQVL